MYRAVFQLKSDQMRVESSLRCSPSRSFVEPVARRPRSMPPCRAAPEIPPPSEMIDPEFRRAYRVDVTQPGWWRQVDDWAGFFHKDGQDIYLMDDGKFEDYFVEDPAVELGGMTIQQRVISPQHLYKAGLNPAAVRERGEDTDVSDPELVAQAAADDELEADFDAEDVAEGYEEDAPTPAAAAAGPRARGRPPTASQTGEGQPAFRHVILKMLADRPELSRDPNFRSIMTHGMRKEILFGGATSSEEVSPYAEDPEQSEWDLRARMEKRRRMEREQAEWDRKRGLIGAHPSYFAGKQDVRLQKSPGYDDIYGKEWTEEEIWNLITMDGAAADPRRLADRAIKIMNPEARYDFPGTYGYKHTLETEEYLMKIGHLAQVGEVDTEASFSMLSDSFRDMAALDALGAGGEGDGKMEADDGV